MTYYKYPRTPHLPFSASKTSDDKTLDSDSHFYDMERIIISTKMDGENTTVYPDGKCHARSIDSPHRDYHSWLLNDIQNWYYKIPKGYRVCGEYLYAKHSIKYEYLDSYFEVFSIWKDTTCLSWPDTVDMCNDLGLCTVPVFYYGTYDTDMVKDIAVKTANSGSEGIVVRNYNSFELKDFDKNIAKYVRPNHVQTDEHWSMQTIEHNLLASM